MQAEMVEWSITAVLKTVEARVSGGSNPSLRANGEVEFEKNFTSPTHNFLKEIAEMLISVQARDLFISGIVIGLPLKFNTVSVVWKFGRL